MLKQFIGTVSAVGILVGTAQAAGLQSEEVLGQMKKVASWQMEQFANKAPGNWVNATAFAGFAEMYHVYRDEAFEQKVMRLGERNNWDFEHGLKRMPYHADHHAQGQLALEMYVYKHRPEMLETIKGRLNYVLDNPTSCGLTHDSKKNKERWNWCDALFMAPPVWLRLYALTGDERYINYMDQEFWATSDYLYSPGDKLMFRDDRFFEKLSKNGKKVFWGRGNGWVYGGLARVLELYPEDRPARKKYLDLYMEMTEGILACRLEGGLWATNLLDPEEVPGNELSASAFFCYGLAWGVNQGILDKKTYWPIVEDVWTKMQDYVLEDGRFVGVQQVGYDPKAFKKDSTKPYGTGAYLLAGSQIYQQLTGNKVDKPALYAAAGKKVSKAGGRKAAIGLTTFMEDGGWCWFQDPRAIVHDGKLFIGSVTGNGAGPALVGVYDLEADKPVGTVLMQDSFGKDDHNSPVFHVRPDGSVLATYAKHNRDKFHYSRISDPNDPMKWSDEFRHKRASLNPKDRVTYMNLHELKDEGLLYNFYRGINYNPTFVTSTDHGKTWSEPVHFFRNEVGGRHRPYARYTSNGKDTVCVSITDAHPRNYGNSLYYFEFRAGSFYKADGTLVKSLSDGALAPSEAEKVYKGSETQAKPEGCESVPNSAWTSSVAIDAKGNPHIGYTLYLDNNDHRYRIASWDGSRWIDREVAFGGKCLYPRESSYTGLITLDPADPTVVFISTDVNPSTGKDLGGLHEIYRAKIGVADSVDTIEWEAVTKNSPVRNIRPVILRGAGKRVVLWQCGRYSTYVDYDLDTIGFQEDL